MCVCVCAMRQSRFLFCQNNHSGGGDRGGVVYILARFAARITGATGDT